MCIHKWQNSTYFNQVNSFQARNWDQVGEINRHNLSQAIEKALRNLGYLIPYIMIFLFRITSK